jgi:hypothetical protein
MKHLLVVIAALCAFAGPTSAQERSDRTPPHCFIAAIWRDGGVTIDWKCVDLYAAKPDLQDAAVFSAKSLKAMHAGTNPTVDWDSVDASAAKWKPDTRDQTVVWAYVLKAAHDGQVFPK